MAVEYRQIDLSWLAQNLPSEPGFVRELFELFERQSGNLQALLTQVLTEGELLNLHEKVHKLRGSAATVGLGALSARLADLDQRLKTERDIEELRPALLALNQQLKEAEREMHLYIDNHNSN